MAENGITPDEIQNLSDLSKLPITSKKSFTGRPTEEYTDNSRPLTGRWVTTSGTSGIVFAPLRRAIAHLPGYRDSLRYRFLMDQKLWYSDISWARIAHLRVLPLQLRQPNSITILAKDLFSDPKTVLKTLVDFDPLLIEGHASFLQELASAVRTYGFGPSPRYAVSVSERLLPAVRSHIQETLRCEVYNLYALEEFGAIGVECTEHDGFHVNVESCIVEVVDEQGHPVPEGHGGKVLITDLYNYEMSFVRYDSGDRGRVSWEKCACGLESPRLWFDGRYSAFLTFHDRKYHQFEFSEAMQAFTPYLFQYQVAKKSEMEVDVRIMPTRSYTETAQASLQKTLEALMGPNISVRVIPTTSISRLPRGKSKIVTDESSAESHQTLNSLI